MNTPTHVTHAGELTLPGTPAEVFPLFTPEGERRWVPGWAPEWLHPPGGALEADAVFRTAAHGEETLWMILAVEAGAHARYLRVTPGNRIGTVDVSCRPAASEAGAPRTTVRVAYELTALSDAGRAELAGFDDAAYVEMLDEWRAMTLPLLTSTR